MAHQIFNLEAGLGLGLGLRLGLGLVVRVAYKHGTDKGNARKRQHDRTPKTRQDKTR